MSPLKVNSSNKENVKVDVSKLKALSTHDTAKDPLKLKTNTLQPNSKSTKTPQKFKIHEDPNSKPSSTKKYAVTKSTSEHQGTQTKLTGPDLMDFTEMISPDVTFYKDLAEKRREALNESLKENEELHIEKELLKCQNEEQKETILSLEETVEKARKIMELIEPCLTDDDCEEQNEISPPLDDAKSESDNIERSDSLSEISCRTLDENEDAKVQIE